MPFPAQHGTVAAAAGGTPLDYGDDLVFFLDAENGVTESSNLVSLWTDQGDDAIAFDNPSGDEEPIFQSSAVNGLPGINFSEDVGTASITRRVRSSSNLLDNIFGGAGDKSLGFALRIDKFVDDNFGVESFVCDKGTRGSGSNRNGWRLRFESDGSLAFRHYRADDSFWELEASGFYSLGDLVLGNVVYDGGNSSGSGTFCLYNPTTGQFVETGSVSTGSSSTIGSDSDGNLNVGNQEGPSNGFNSPLQGPMMALWATSPARTSLDKGYLSRWIA